MFSISCRRICTRNILRQLHSLSSFNSNKYTPIIHNFYTKVPLEFSRILNVFNTQIVRHKGYNKKQQKNESQSESESSDDDDEDLRGNKHSKIVKINVASLRLDAIIKNSLGIARNKIDVLFYESKIRVNGEKPLKKAVTIQEGDEIDVIKGPDARNPDFINVARIEIISMTALDESISIKIKRTKSMLIEDYDK